jgi:hypothetical protein
MARIVTPQTLTIDSTNVAASSYPAYSAGTTYALGANVSAVGTDGWTHEYESLQASNLGNALTDTAYWLDLGTSNRHRMFNGFNNSRTIADSGEDIEVTVTPDGRARYLYLIGLRNVAEVTVEEEVDSTVESTTVIDMLRSRNPVGPYAWLTDIEGIDRYYARSVAIPLPGQYFEPQLNITLSSSAALAECGQVIVGVGFPLGETEWDVEPSLRDYSTFEKDGFGVTQYVPRETTRDVSGTLWVDTRDYPRVYGLFESQMGGLALYDINNEDTGDYSLDPIRVYGKLKSFSGGIAYEKTPINVTVEGLE